MNMARPAAIKYYANVLCKVTKEISQESMKKAAEEAVLVEVEENDDSLESRPNRDITITLDGSWQKRGHSSQNGVVTAISGKTGKVLDVEILSKYCRCTGRFKKEHLTTCAANYLGSSGGMEVAGAVAIFERSQTIHNVRYKYYLGDGDTASFATVAQKKPYGPDFLIEKLECVGHVQKRMGTRLRKLKTKLGKNELSDGKTIGGRNRLTDAAIRQITTYYGLAIRRNTSSLQNMLHGVWAVWYHIVSTNDDPAHGLCPKDNGTWCKFQKAKLNNESYNHDNHFHLPLPVMTAIKPIFKDLSSRDLLKKCLHGGTQNPSESLNNMIWSRIPKRVFVMKTVLDLGVHEAVSCFNKGNIVRCEVLDRLGIVPGINCVKVLQAMDETRIKKAEKAMDEIEKKCRQKSSLAKRRLEDEYEEEEDPDNPSYCAGMH